LSTQRSHWHTLEVWVHNEGPAGDDDPKVNPAGFNLSALRIDIHPVRNIPTPVPHCATREMPTLPPHDKQAKAENKITSYGPGAAPLKARTLVTRACRAQDVDLLFRRGIHEKREIGFGVNIISIDRAIEQARQRLRPASTAQVCNAEFRP
jgi:hypothetical protein